MICFLEKERRTVPRNEGSGGSNEILVGDWSKVWDWSFKVAFHGSVMFYELQIAYKLLTLFCWLIPILGEEGWVGLSEILQEICTFHRILLRVLNIGWHLAVIDCCQIVCGPKVLGKWQKGCKMDVGTLCPWGKGGGSIHGSRRRHRNA